MGGYKLEACVKNVSKEEKCAEVWFSLEGCTTVKKKTESVKLSDETDTAQEQISLGSISLCGEEEGKLKKTVWCEGAKEWSMEEPNLYRMNAVLVLDGIAADDWMERIGMRIVETEGRKILINGRSVLIKGFCRHEDHPLFGCALPYEAIDYDLNVMQRSGSKFRAHQPLSQ